MFSDQLTTEIKQMPSYDKFIITASKKTKLCLK